MGRAIGDALSNAMSGSDSSSTEGDGGSIPPSETVDDLGGGEYCADKEHTKNRSPSNWNKHTKPRPGRESEKKRKQPGWKPNPNKPK